MLALLKHVHAELRLAIAELARETAKSRPDPDRLPAARLHLSRLSGRRRSLIEGAILPTLYDITPEDAREIADLRREATAIMVETSEHIAEWTTRQIAADWPGYQRASAAMRGAMLLRIDREAALLYPLLLP